LLTDALLTVQSSSVEHLCRRSLLMCECSIANVVVHRSFPSVDAKRQACEYWISSAVTATGDM